jgi:DNA-3-methyladenine glycosylase II
VSPGSVTADHGPRLSDEQRRIHDGARRFAENGIAPAAGEYDREGRYPHDSIDTAAEMGMLDASVPVEYGGAGYPSTCTFRNHTANRPAPPKPSLPSVARRSSARHRHRYQATANATRIPVHRVSVDVSEAHDHLRDDPVMARLIDDHGEIGLEPAENGFRRLVVAIINQSISTASATAVRERVFEPFDEVTPQSVLDADPEALRDAGLGETKTEYVRNAARAFEERDLTRADLADASDEEVIDRLTEIRGIGAWTGRMYLLFVLGREDVFPIGDLAVRRGIESLYGEMTREEMHDLAERWRPYRSIAVRYIWAHYES